MAELGKPLVSSSWFLVVLVVLVVAALPQCATDAEEPLYISRIWCLGGAGTCSLICIWLGRTASRCDFDPRAACSMAMGLSLSLPCRWQVAHLSRLCEQASIIPFSGPFALSLPLETTANTRHPKTIGNRQHGLLGLDADIYDIKFDTGAFAATSQRIVDLASLRGGQSGRGDVHGQACGRVTGTLDEP